MSEVKRYSVWDDELFDEKHAINARNGMVHLVVKFDDYAELQDKCAALAAENAWLKDYLAPIGLKVEGTPATDSFLSEMRAQGVEMFADNLLCPELDDTIRDFAAQLRKGVEQK